jgi:outer membrane protein insertion porin family
MAAFTLEWQFPIAEPLHGLLFTDWGGTWSGIRDFRWDSIHRSVGVGFRMEVPLLGLIGFDYGYGFDRLDRATGRYDGRGGKAHIQFGRIF